MKENSSHKSQTSIHSGNEDNKLDKVKFLWEEYKYRHELCWNLVFKITAAIIIILIVPYTKTEIAKAITYWMVFLPLIALALLAFSYRRLSNELTLLYKIRTKYRELQTFVYDIKHDHSCDTFSDHVKLYLIGLGLLCIADIVAIALFWIPDLLLKVGNSTNR